ncbi:pyridoxamine 5'-phosphate oxidase family protein [Saccharopolyspora sp. ID03-671]|uniref:pyridoxamine 5'-phosphate oxidase family protein n=1 Tax=Saccharopolyspora sp. ID03-671 TaxID=3073066 RepID=UPI003251DE77
MELEGAQEITSTDELEEVVGRPLQRVLDKQRPALHQLDVGWLAASPFCLVATSDEQGRCDVSPKGHPAGFTLVLDERTIAIPERPGNRRVDGFRNVLANPHVGLVYLIPGRGDTLRINGRARLLRDAPFFDRMVVRGHRPSVVLLVEIEEVFHHCSKAFLRSGLWNAETWNPEAVPSSARLAKNLTRPNDPIDELERYYSDERFRSILYDAEA